MAWFDLPVLRATPLGRRRADDREYELWMEVPRGLWPDWVYRRWQAERYEEDGC